MSQFIFRNATEDDLDQIIQIEQICFPPNEACKPERLKERLEKMPMLILCMVDIETGKLAGFLNGVANDEEAFRDEFFTDISLSFPSGKHVMIMGVDVLPEYRMQGLAREMMKNYLAMVRTQGKEKVFLTCHDGLVRMYQSFGFIDEGIANSNWGGEKWHQMTMVL